MKKELENKNKNNKVINVDFECDKQNQPKKQTPNFQNHSNPVLKKLSKLTHSELMKNKNDYKSFSEFKPKDLI